jgi:signal transduction protein with GAF and PtsI domain
MALKQRRPLLRDVLPDRACRVAGRGQQPCRRSPFNERSEVMPVKKMDFFSALYDVAKVINASLELPRVLDQVVEVVVNTMMVKASSVRLLDRGRKRLLLAATHGLTAGYVRKGPVLVAKSGLDRKAIKGETVWLKNAQTDKDFQYGERAQQEGITSLLVVPLVVGKKAIGVLRVYSAKVREFSEQETRFLEAVAHLSALAIENARLHQELKTEYDLLSAHKYRLDDN